MIRSRETAAPPDARLANAAQGPDVDADLDIDLAREETVTACSALFQEIGIATPGRHRL